MDGIIASSARRHGILDADIEHAFDHPMAAFELDDDTMHMIVGGDRSGRLLEIGYVDAADLAAVVIVHAMPARAKYLEKW